MVFASPFKGLEVEEALRPRSQSVGFDLSHALSSVVVLEARVSEDAFTAATLGAERLGNAIVISPDGLVLTIGYLVTEAEEVMLTTSDGRRVHGHVLGVDTSTGLGLVHALEPLDVPVMPIGDSRRLGGDETLVVAGGGGRAHALSGRLLTRAPFSGYWEYHLDESLFVEPAHPHWSGAALIDGGGSLVGIGSLRMERQASDGTVHPFNMFVPAELLPPILDDLASGRPAAPPRPWLGVFSQELDAHVVVLDVSKDSPAARAELRRGDVIWKVGEHRVTDLAEFYTRLWSLGDAGVTVPLTLQRDGDVFDVEIRSMDRAAKFRKPRLN